jgi:hypothetical protein
MTSPWDCLKEESEASALRWQALVEYARKQGIVVVHLTKRRSLVVRVNGLSCGVHGQGDGCRRTWMGGEVLYGPARWQRCEQWLLDNTPPLPPELCPH